MKIQRVVLQSAYILHTRPYRETSLLVECFARDYGRISLIAKGVRKQKSRCRNLLQPFQPLLLSWCGRTDLYTLTGIEPTSPGFILRRDSLICGLYLNELLLRLIHRGDPDLFLYEAYALALTRLADEQTLQATLRIFEWQLLQSLGYAFSLTQDCREGENLSPDAYYRFELPQGLTKTMAETPGAFLGQYLLDFSEAYFADAAALREAKRLMRLALLPLLGDKPLKSRELFIS